MGANAEESLAHDDKRRYVEDEVRGQIVEVQAVVEHESPDEWVEWKTQSAEEVGKKYYPLMGPWGGEKLPLLGKPVRDVLGQVSGLPQLFYLNLRDGGDLPLASCSGHCWRTLR